MKDTVVVLRGHTPKSAIHQIAFPTKRRTFETYKTSHGYNNKLRKLDILLRNILNEFSA